MDIFESIRDIVDSLESDVDDGPSYVGAYWCDECSNRNPVTAEDVDDDHICPDCGEPMRLERSPDSGDCAR